MSNITTPVITTGANTPSGIQPILPMPAKRVPSFRKCTQIIRLFFFVLLAGLQINAPEVATNANTPSGLPPIMAVPRFVH